MATEMVVAIAAGVVSLASLGICVLCVTVAKSLLTDLIRIRKHLREQTDLVQRVSHLGAEAARTAKEAAGTAKEAAWTANSAVEQVQGFLRQEGGL